MYLSKFGFFCRILKLFYFETLLSLGLCFNWFEKVVVSSLASADTPKCYRQKLWPLKKSIFNFLLFFWTFWSFFRKLTAQMSHFVFNRKSVFWGALLCKGLCPTFFTQKLDPRKSQIPDFSPFFVFFRLLKNTLANIRFRGSSNHSYSSAVWWLRLSF